MSFQLYPHQTQFLNEIRSRIAAGDSRVLGQAPTGFGKTVVATEIAQGAVRKGSRLWFIVHRKELLLQTEQAFLSSGITPDFIAAGQKFRNAQVSLCSIMTLVNRVVKLPDHPDIVVWDEAHHCPSQSYADVMNMLPNAVHVGLSATPIRLDGRGLGKYFNSIVPGPSVKWLIDNGYLADYDVYSTPVQPDLKGVRKVAGDFSKKQLAARVDNPDIAGNALRHYLDVCRGKQAIAFCINVDHSTHTCEAFRAAGVRAEHLDAGSDKVHRSEVMARFRAGDVDVLFNVDLFGEGVDVPAVECAILLRPTASLSLYLQQVGRALRRKPDGSKAIILDHAGNVMRHGLPDEQREWSLDGVNKQAQEREVAAKQCPDCFHIHNPSPVCPKCGHVYERQVKEIVVDEGATLEKLDKDFVRKQRMRQQGSAKDYDSLVKLGMSRGMKNPQGWARHVLEAREAKAARQTG